MASHPAPAVIMTIVLIKTSLNKALVLYKWSKTHNNSSLQAVESTVGLGMRHTEVCRLLSSLIRWMCCWCCWRPGWYRWCHLLDIGPFNWSRDHATGPFACLPLSSPRSVSEILFSRRFVRSAPLLLRLLPLPLRSLVFPISIREEAPLRSAWYLESCRRVVLRIHVVLEDLAQSCPRASSDPSLLLCRSRVPDMREIE